MIIYSFRVSARLNCLPLPGLSQCFVRVFANVYRLLPFFKTLFNNCIKV